MNNPDESWGLLGVDPQVDFCPGGSLAVAGGDEIMPLINRMTAGRLKKNRKYFSRDKHPHDTTHFDIWPRHCEDDTPGFQFHPDLIIPEDAIIISKGTRPDEDAYSAFDGRTEDGISFEDDLHAHGITGLYVCGLATDYCVLKTVMDALEKGFKVRLIVDAIRAVNQRSTDGVDAIRTMTSHGAEVVDSETL